MITSMNPVADPGTSQTPPSAQKSLGKDDFLQLLVAQLSAQDPLNPMEAQDFSAQLAQFSSLEQMTNINSTLKEIKLSQDALSNSSMITLIGKTVDVPGNTFEFEPGQQANMSYILPETAKAVFVDVYDAAGQLVTTLNGGADAGTNLVTWGGISGAGAEAEAGAYSFKVRALTAEGNPIESQAFTTGIVTDVLFEGGIAYAVVNKQKIEAGNITRVSSL